MLKEKRTKLYSFGEQTSNNTRDLSAEVIGAKDPQYDMTIPN